MLLKFQAVVIILVRTVKGYTILDKIRSEKVWRSKEFLHLPTKLRNGWHRKVLCKIWSSCSVVMAIFKMWHHVIGWMVPEILMAPHSFETLGTTYPTTPTSHPLKPLKPFFFFFKCCFHLNRSIGNSVTVLALCYKESRIRHINQPFCSRTYCMQILKLM